MNRQKEKVMTQAFDLKVRDRQTRKTFTRVWDGRNEEDAARRYVDCFRDHEVFATRPHRETNVVLVGMPGRIIEPGDRSAVTQAQAQQ